MINNVRIIKNISLSFISKMASVVISYSLVPITINYLNLEQYGVWVTLLSLISWITFFDIGLGNGLRNKLTEALSKNDIKSAREFISTTYAALTVIVSVIFMALLVIVPNINWGMVFNTEVLSNSEFIKLILIVLCFFLFNFVLSLYNQLFYAFQEAALTGVGQLLFNLFTLINIMIVKGIGTGNLISLGNCYGMAMALSSVCLTVYFFTRHKGFLPKLKFVKRDKIKSILSIGFKFLIIDIAEIVIFTSDNIIITQVLGPEDVTPYSTVLKLFSAVIMGHAIIITPLWSAYTQAYIKGDIKWIKAILRKLNLLMLPIVLGVSFIVLISDKILELWVGDNMTFPKYLISFMAIYSLFAIWKNIYAYFLNGIGALNVQMYSSIVGALINIPVSILLSKHFGFGSSGVILGTIISMCIFNVLGPIKVFRIIKSKDSESSQAQV